MDISLAATVLDSGGQLVGVVTGIHIACGARQVTHVSVRESATGTQLQLPVRALSDANVQNVWLRGELGELEKLMQLPSTAPPTPGFAAVASAADEIVLLPGADVRTRDGQHCPLLGVAAKVNSGYITHLMVKEKHFFREHQLRLEWTYVDHIEDNTIHLNIDKRKLRSFEATATPAQ